jgi:NADPH-dependent 2,4-dienoyl-CoA reductase/sulfur reductase-like enzyme
MGKHIYLVEGPVESIEVAEGALRKAGRRAVLGCEPRDKRLKLVEQLPAWELADVAWFLDDLPKSDAVREGYRLGVSPDEREKARRAYLKASARKRELEALLVAQVEKVSQAVRRIIVTHGPGAVVFDDGQWYVTGAKRLPDGREAYWLVPKADGKRKEGTSDRAREKRKSERRLARARKRVSASLASSSGGEG